MDESGAGAAADLDCRFCGEGALPGDTPFKVCRCETVIHGRCLQRWLEARSEIRAHEGIEDSRTCEVCLAPYRVTEGHVFVPDLAHVCRPSAHGHLCSALLLVASFACITVVITSLPGMPTAASGMARPPGGNSSTAGAANGDGASTASTPKEWWLLLVGLVVTAGVSLAALRTIARRWVAAASDVVLVPLSPTLAPADAAPTATAVAVAPATLHAIASSDAIDLPDGAPATSVAVADSRCCAADDTVTAGGRCCTPLSHQHDADADDNSDGVDEHGDGIGLLPSSIAGGEPLRRQRPRFQRPRIHV